MTLDDLKQSLPNGFHDAVIKRLELDLIRRVLQFRAEIWIGDVAASTEEERESYRTADVTVSNVQWIVIDPPDVSAFRQSDSITVDLFEGDLAIAAVGQLAGDGFTARLFVHEWNGFIHIAGSDARLTWADEPAPNG